ncbi:TA system VapC family ribonuclease toxin [Actinoplanes sp. CA-015351]|uniref:TA system VapC family ribonuclease toxin n=1 Tax=Actinoplanes sp. CA-015351 TaxID=3239897 RepID=UPI003D983257
MTVLLDANVLIALLVDDHVHHHAAQTWFASSSEVIATCPITQGSLVRLLLREGQPAQTAKTLISALMVLPRHEFWADDAPFDAVLMDGVIGHRQVTDAYLAHLARVRQGRLATFDHGLAKLHSDVADLVPVR